MRSDSEKKDKLIGKDLFSDPSIKKILISSVSLSNYIRLDKISYGS